MDDQLRLGGGLRAYVYVEAGSFVENDDAYGYSSASVTVRDRRSGLEVHCWADEQAEPEIDGSRSASLVLDQESRCHTHQRRSQRGRGSLSVALAWEGTGTRDGGSSHSRSGDVRCRDRWSSRAAAVDGTLHLIAPRWDLDVTIAIEQAEGVLGSYTSTCHTVGR